MHFSNGVQLVFSKDDVPSINQSINQS